MKLRKGDTVLASLLVLSFASETLHGILTHELGTENYFSVTIGELVRGSIFVSVVAYTMFHFSQRWNRQCVFVLAGSAMLVCTQAIIFSYDVGAIVETLLRLSKWLYVLFIIAFVSSYTRRHQIPGETVISLVKWLVIIFYCLPIILSFLGIAGYTVYGPDSGRYGYAGFAMNSNAVASVFVFLLPYYLDCRRMRDYLNLLLFVAAGLMLGSKLVYLGFTIVLVLVAIQKAATSLSRSSLPIRLRIRRNTARTIVLAASAMAILLFTPLSNRMFNIFEGLANLFNWYMSGGMGYQSSFIDVLTSHRTLRLHQFLAWVQNDGSLLPLLIGGGAPNYSLLYAEVDWIDLVSLFGILGLVFFYGILVYLMFSIYQRKGRPYRSQTALALALAIGISLTSGHTFDGPVIGMILGYVLGSFFGAAPKRETTARQVPGFVGGVAQALPASGNPL